MLNAGGMMTSWLVCLTLDRAVQVYKWVTTTLMLGVALNLHPIQEGGGGGAE